MQDDVSARWAVLEKRVMAQLDAQPVQSGASQVALLVKNPSANARDIRDVGSVPGSRRSPGGHGNPLQYSHLENPMDREAWRATVHGVTKSRTRLSNWLTVTSGSPSSPSLACQRILFPSHTYSFLTLFLLYFLLPLVFPPPSNKLHEKRDPVYCSILHLRPVSGP